MRSFRRGRRKVPSSPPCTGTTSSRRRRESMHWFRRSPIRCRGNPRQNTSARVARFESARYGFAVLADYWAIAPASGGCVREDGGVLSYADREAGQLRFASFTADRPTGPLPRGRAGRRLAQLGCGSARRQFFRATSPFCGRRGAPGRGAVDKGATVCSCFGVGARQIAAAVAGGCVTVDSIGRALQAGTNCGSCRSEIREIIDAHRLQAAE